MRKRVLIVLIISFLLDQITKLIVDLTIGFGNTVPVINSFFSITRTTNTGAAFSMLEGKGVLLILVGIITALYLVKYIKEFKNLFRVDLAFGLIIGGIIGNLLDRFVYGFVRDFLKFDIFSYTFPIFNIADTCIVIGVFLLIYCMLRGDEIDSSSK